MKKLLILTVLLSLIVGYSFPPRFSPKAGEEKGVVLPDENTQMSPNLPYPKKTEKGTAPRTVSMSDKIKKAQMALKKAGFDPGEINGSWNKKTKKALIAFQSSKGLPASGILESKTVRKLGNYLKKRKGGSK